MRHPTLDPTVPDLADSFFHEPGLRYSMILAGPPSQGHKLAAA